MATDSSNEDQINVSFLQNTFDTMRDAVKSEAISDVDSLIDFEKIIGKVENYQGTKTNKREIQSAVTRFLSGVNDNPSIRIKMIKYYELWIAARKKHVGETDNTL